MEACHQGALWRNKDGTRDCFELPWLVLRVILRSTLDGIEILEDGGPIILVQATVYRRITENAPFTAYFTRFVQKMYEVLHNSSYGECVYKLATCLPGALLTGSADISIAGGPLPKASPGPIGRAPLAHRYHITGANVTHSVPDIY